MTDYIRAYHDAIERGEIIAGRWIRLWYNSILSGLDEGRFFYDEKKAQRAIRFVEAFCHHCEGRSDLLQLELWQKAFLCVVFGIVDETGNRQFREIVLIVARKNGKTLFAAAIAAYCAYADGEYGGKIYFVAPKLAQANICYSAFWESVKAEPELQDLTKHRKSDIYIEATNTSLEKLAFSSKKSDGFNPSLTVCDEIASWPGDRGMKQYDVMTSARGARRQPLTLSVSTAGYENEGIYDELMKRCTRVLLGESRETRLAPFLYIIDDLTRWNQLDELRKSNPNMGVSVTEAYLLDEIAIAEGSLPKKAEFLTKYCNVKQSSAQAWLPATAVQRARSGQPLRFEEFRGCYAVGGIDLSRTTDLTACVAVIERDGRLHVFAHFFLPGERLAEAIERDNLPYNAYVERSLLTLSGANAVDYQDCFRWFADLVERYQIYPLQVGYDRYSATYLVADMKAYGFHMDDVYQGYNLTPVITEADGLFRDGVIDIGDNDLLAVHLLNSALQTDAQQGRSKLIKLAAADHIDGAAALLDALTVRQKWYGEIGGQLKNIGKGVKHGTV